MLLCSLAQAAVVNTITPSIGPPEEGLSAELSAGGAAAFGNADKTSVSGGGRLESHFDPHAVRAVLSAEHTIVSGDLYAQNAFGWVRYDWSFSDGWALYGFVQGDHNAVRRLLLRDLVGAGVDRRLWRTERAEAHLALSAMSEHQVLDEGVEDDDGGLHARGNAMMTHAVELDAGVTLTSVTFFQPRLDRRENWRVFEELVLTLALTDRFSWSYSGTLEHDREPPEGVAATDVSLASSLSLRL